MTDTHITPQTKDAETAVSPTTHYASFIVRCWQDGDAHLRARLIDVNTDTSHPIADLNQLPVLLQHLLRRMLFHIPGDNIQSE